MKRAAQRTLHRLFMVAIFYSADFRLAAAVDFIELTAEIELNDWSYWFLDDRRDFLGTATSQRSIFQEPLKVRCVIGTDSWLMEGPFVRNAIVTRWFTGSNLVEQTRITSPVSIPGAPNNFDLRASSPPVGQLTTRTHETADGNPGRPVRVEDLFRDASGKVCWLAFFSGRALKREGRRIPLPSALWKQFFSGEHFSDDVTHFEDPLALPKSIEVYQANQHLLLNYQVRSSTNILGWNIPLEFYLLQYRPSQLPRTNSIELHLTAKGKVTGVRLGSAPAIEQKK